MIIKNGLVFTPQCTFEPNTIKLQDQNIDQIFPYDFTNTSSDFTYDATDCYVIPGLTDIHFHGCMGYDFCDGTIEALDAIAAYELSNGITTICPATMTLSDETLKKIGITAASYVEKQQKNPQIPYATLCGINMEGPFLSLEKKGAQNPLYLKDPTSLLFDELQTLSGHLIKLVAIAPEQPDAMQFIKQYAGKVVLSLAHTCANYELAMEAFQNGATHVTHLYNAMLPFSHRNSGVIGAAMDSNSDVEIICDGIHISPPVIRATYKMFDSDQIILISDSMMATGMKDGSYSLGGQAVSVTGNLATLADGTIAGSVTNLMDCMRQAVKMEIPLELAVKSATINPAKSIGIQDQYGSIEPGKIANLVILNTDLSIKDIIFQGKIL